MSWQVQEAKRKFSALIQRALDEGPQIVTRRGEEIVVIISANEFRRLTGDKPDFREFLLLARGQEAEVRRLFARGGATVPDGLDWAWDRRADDPPPPSRLALDGADSGLVRGFYGPERGDGGRPFRWMGGRGEVRLAAPPPGRPAVLSLTLAAPPPPDAPPVEVLVAVNGREVGRATVRRDRGWNDIRLALPADLDPARPLTVELRAPIVRLDPDRRALGVAVASVAVEPAP